MIRIGANITSQTVQRSLGRSTAGLSAASERLSSGQRINRASDDAAGLAISTSLNAGSAILRQGIRNLNDGISAVSIAEGALTELGGIVDRIQELATQSRTGSLSDTQRDSLQRETSALQSEWNRIVESTSFNGMNLLTGDNTRLVLQGGTGTDNALAVQIGATQFSGGVVGFAGGVQRISLASDGTQGNGPSDGTMLVADGTVAVIASQASNFAAADSNVERDIFLRDMTTGQLTLVSRTSSGAVGNGRSGLGAEHLQVASSTGRYVLFWSDSTNLIANDTNGTRDLFVRDTLLGVTQRVNTNSSGAQSTSASIGSISGDGRMVMFQSLATDLVTGDANGQQDVFLKDLTTGATSILSSSSSGVQSNGISSAGTFSASGRYAAFTSAGSNLVTNDTNGVADIFVRDLATGSLIIASSDRNGVLANGASSNAVMSQEGRYVAFNSTATNLVSGDGGTTQDVFVKDLQTGEVRRASVTATGIEGNGASSVTSISADGRFVGFTSSASNLVAQDTNSATDAFVKDMVTGDLIRVSTTSAGAQLSSGSSWVSLSSDGRKVLFTNSGADVVSGDTNSSDDVFLRDLRRVGISQMSGMVVANQVSAGITLSLADTYRNELLSYRGGIGATTSRLQSFLATLSSADINYQAASSRIMDADIASEAADVVRLSILQRTGAELLGQANLNPQIALRLLQDA